jgi:hypothetical protein
MRRLAKKAVCGLALSMVVVPALAQQGGNSYFGRVPQSYFGKVPSSGRIYRANGA